MVAAYKVFHGHADVKDPSPFFQGTRNGGYVARFIKKNYLDTQIEFYLLLGD